MLRLEEHDKIIQPIIPGVTIMVMYLFA